MKRHHKTGTIFRDSNPTDNSLLSLFIPKLNGLTAFGVINLIKVDADFELNLIVKF